MYNERLLGFVSGLFDWSYSVPMVVIFIVVDYIWVKVHFESLLDRV